MRTSALFSHVSHAVRSAVLGSVMVVTLYGARAAHADVVLPEEDAAADSGTTSTDGGSTGSTSGDASAKDASAADSGTPEFGDHQGGGAFSECSSGPGVARLSAPWIVAMAAAFAFRRRSRR